MVARGNIRSVTAVNRNEKRLTTPIAHAEEEFTEQKK